MSLPIILHFPVNVPRPTSISYMPKLFFKATINVLPRVSGELIGKMFSSKRLR